jgi:hypothetical protein
MVIYGYLTNLSKGMPVNTYTVPVFSSPYFRKFSYLGIEGRKIQNVFVLINEVG